jgi:hypothetical protein
LGLSNLVGKAKAAWREDTTWRERDRTGRMVLTSHRKRQIGYESYLFIYLFIFQVRF